MGAKNNYACIPLVTRSIQWGSSHGVGPKIARESVVDCVQGAPFRTKMVQKTNVGKGNLQVK